VVLSAKKVIRPKSEVFCNLPGELHDNDVEIEGHGILLETVGQDPKDHLWHFRRTGAFRFRARTEQEFNMLLVTAGSEGLPAEEFDTKRGRKFWLD
jgi:hypothetical protein